MESKSPENKLAVLTDRPGISPDLVKLESVLLDWRESVITSCGNSYPAQTPDGETIAEGITNGLSLMKSVDPMPSPEMLYQHLTDFLTKVTELLPTIKPFATWMETITDSQTRDAELSKWFTASWQGDAVVLAALEKKIELEAEILGWMGRQFCKPFFHQLATMLTVHPAFKKRDANIAGCPCCGGAPRMGRYDREEGRRFLWCDLCNIQWEFPRIVCPFCGNRSHETQGYLSVDGSNEQRIDVCENCRGYLRTIVERDRLEGDRVDFTIEDVGMLHLCFVAEQQNYRPGVLTSCSGECACGAGSNEPDAV